jgi:hypothetical protein
MDEDRVTKLFAGHIGVCAVLVNILIDKGEGSEQSGKH